MFSPSDMIADPQRVSAAILLSTLVSVVSFPRVAWLALD